MQVLFRAEVSAKSRKISGRPICKCTADSFKRTGIAQKESMKLRLSVRQCAGKEWSPFTNLLHTNERLAGGSAVLSLPGR